MTYEEFIQQISRLELNHVYPYVPSATGPGRSYTLLSVANDEIKVSRDGVDVSVSVDHIRRVLDSLHNLEPLDVEATLRGSGNDRSIIESLFCLTPFIFHTRIHNRKHIIMLPMREHTLGELKLISEEEISDIIRQQKELNRQNVRNDYRTYLSTIVRSRKTGNRLTAAAILNYLNFVECDRLFDYAPDRWEGVESIYDISSVDEINRILHQLLSDQDFIERNENDNRGFRSRALAQYRDFLSHKASTVDNSGFEDEYEIETGVDEDMPEKILQKIFFGAPGTGKSFKIDDPQNGCGLKTVKTEYKFRTTFHPDYDYAQFVGSYKPRTISTVCQNNDGQNGNEEKQVIYVFSPQVFAKAYIKSWIEFLKVSDNNAELTVSMEGEDAGQDHPEMQDELVPKPVYLVIEEINRGNCAQIFGDIFQLLDRAEDHSSYPIDIDSDFAKYIEEQLSEVKLEDGSIANYWTQYKKCIQEWANLNTAADDVLEPDEDFCKIAFPPTLNILATMNTSDQSLFPMDSAFKRRFDWEYVPIDYAHPNAGFDIEVGDKKYKWLDFLKAVNANVAKVTKSEDKQMGEFFIKHSIDYKEFRSKVLFYLWDSVYKDEEGNKDAEKVFHFKLEGEQDETLTFQKLFEGDDETQKTCIAKIMSNLGVLDQNAPPQGGQGEGVVLAEPAPAEEPNPAQ